MALPAEQQDDSLVPLEEARKRLPTGPDGAAPTIRWVSEEARRLGCYRKIGKHAYIEKAAWRNFVWGVPWRQSASLKLDTLSEALLLSRSARRSNDGAGYIYFVDAGDLTKIGFSASHPRERVKKLQTASPQTLVLWGFARGEFDLEFALHRKLKALRRHGEWFELSANDREQLKKVIRDTRGRLVTKRKSEGNL